MCHSAVPGYEGVLEAPKNVRLDSDAAIANHAEQIAMEAGIRHAMPPGNVSEITPEERALIVQWYREAQRLVTHDPADVTVLRGRVLTFVDEPQGHRRCGELSLHRGWRGGDRRRTARSS